MLRLASLLVACMSVEAQAVCDSAQFQAVAQVVDDLCCEGAACTGVPTACNTNCAPTCVASPHLCLRCRRLTQSRPLRLSRSPSCSLRRFLWLYSHCYNIIQQQPQAALTQYQGLASKCRSSEIDAHNGLPCVPKRHSSIAGTWAGTSIPDAQGSMDGEGFCFGATSANTVVEEFSNTYTGDSGAGGLGAHSFDGTGWSVFSFSFAPSPKPTPFLHRLIIGLVRRVQLLTHAHTSPCCLPQGGYG